MQGNKKSERVNLPKNEWILGAKFLVHVIHLSCDDLWPNKKKFNFNTSHTSLFIDL